VALLGHLRGAVVGLERLEARLVRVVAVGAQQVALVPVRLAAAAAVDARAPVARLLAVALAAAAGAPGGRAGGASSATATLASSTRAVERAARLRRQAWRSSTMRCISRSHMVWNTWSRWPTTALTLRATV
jgi:hypothetical protein